jgi:hypothetical protein
MTVPPGAGVPLHHHAVQEAFTLLEGSAEFGRLGDDGEEWLPSFPRPVWRRAGGRRRGRQSEGHDLLQAVARPGE